MKILLHVLAVVALMLVPAGAAAQKNKEVLDREATILALEKSIRNGAGEARIKFVEQKAELFKKDPAFMTGVARAWYFYSGTGDTVQCFKYIDRAIAIDPTYAPAYVQAAEICRRRSNVRDGDTEPLTTDTLEAIAWLEKGMKANPKAPECYYEYAVLAGIKDTKKAEDMFAVLKQADPLCPIDLYRARMYYSLAKLVEGKTKEAEEIKAKYPLLAANYQNNMVAAMEAFGNVNYDQLERNDFIQYIFACAANAKQLHIVDTICPAALARFPKDATFYGAAFDYARQIGERALEKEKSFAVAKIWFDKALDYAHELRYNSVGDTVTNRQIYNIALTYFKRRKYNDAIRVSEEVLALPYASEGYKTSCLQIMIQSYTKNFEYDKAIECSKNFNKQQEEKGQLTYIHLNELAKIYLLQADEEVDTAKKNNKYREAIVVYEEMASKFDDADAKIFAYYNVVVYNNQIDGRSADTYEKAKRFILYMESQSQEIQDKYSPQQLVAYEIACASLYLYVTDNKVRLSPRKKRDMLREASNLAMDALDLDKSNYNAKLIYNATKQYLTPKERRH